MQIKWEWIEDVSIIKSNLTRLINILLVKEQVVDVNQRHLLDLLLIRWAVVWFVQKF